MRILVTGSTGNTCSELIRQLVAEGHEVRGLAHSPQKSEQVTALGAEPVIGDLLDLPSLERAADGAEAMYGLAPVHPREIRMMLNLIDAAKSAGVTRFVYHSVIHAEKHTGIPHFETKAYVERELEDSGLDWTVLHNHYFMQNLNWSKEAIVAGTLPLPLGEARLSAVDVRDIAAVAATCLTQEGHSGKVYRVVGPQALSGPDLAEILSRHLNRPVAYQAVGLDEFIEQSAFAGMPRRMVEDMGVMYRYFQEHDMSETPDDVERILGRLPHSFDEFAERMATLWLREAAA